MTTALFMQESNCHQNSKLWSESGIEGNTLFEISGQIMLLRRFLGTLKKPLLSKPISQLCDKSEQNNGIKVEYTAMYKLWKIDVISNFSNILAIGFFYHFVTWLVGFLVRLLAKNKVPRPLYRVIKLSIIHRKSQTSIFYMYRVIKLSKMYTKSQTSIF